MTEIRHVLDLVTIGVPKFKEELLFFFRELDSHEKQKKVLTRYVSVFHPHFRVWLTGFQNSASTPESKAAAGDSILQEFKKNHQTALLSFMKQMQVYSSLFEYNDLLPTIETINSLMSRAIDAKQGVGPALVIYLIEEWSQTFIPWIKAIATQNNIADLTYLQKHHEIATSHTELTWSAVQSEFDEKNTEHSQQIKIAYDAVIELLTLIFRYER